MPREAHDSMKCSPAILIVLLLLGGRPDGTAQVAQATRRNPPATALQLPSLEGAAHAFPALRDLQGKNLADGDFSQWVESERLHVRISYDFGSEHRIEEKAVFRQQPELVQEAWSWRELKEGELYRQFELDFPSGKVAAAKKEEKNLK